MLLTGICGMFVPAFFLSACALATWRRYVRENRSTLAQLEASNKGTKTTQNTKPFRTAARLGVAAEALEREVWGARAGAPGSPEAVASFAEEFMRPALGAFAWGGPAAPLHEEDLPGGTAALTSALPARLAAAGGLATPLQGLLLADAAAAPPTPPAAGPVVCLEIKPKSGVPLLSADWRALRPPGAPDDPPPGVALYAMQQAQRLAEGRVPRTSRYCPLELFSGDARRAARTLLHLMQEPQNHFRAFRDGVPEASLLPGGLGGQWWPFGARSMAESVLGGGTRAGAPEAEERLAQVLAEILTESGVLAQILRTQQQDRHGLVQALEAYEGLHQKEKLSAPGRHAARQVLKDFSVGATAKDCSVMVALRKYAPETALPGGGGPHHVFDASSCIGRLRGPAAPTGVAYRISVIDLDRKPLRKIPGKVADRRRSVAAFLAASPAY